MNFIQYIYIFTAATMAAKSGNYVRLSLKQQLDDTIAFKSNRTENFYVFDATGYFADAPLKNFSGIKFYVKQNKFYVYNSALLAFENNTNTYTQFLTPSYAEMLVKDEIGIRFVNMKK